MLSTNTKRLLVRSARLLTNQRRTATELTRPLFTGVDAFQPRHIGPRDHDVQSMLKTLNVSSLDELIDDTVPAAIRTGTELDGVPDPVSETEALAELKRITSKNKINHNFIGMGYHGVKTPNVILRNILENPAWYTAYTPYQAEVSQGRMEMLLNFQTMICDLTKLPIANCSLLDEGSAAGEALNMCHTLLRGKRSKFFVADDCHPQTIANTITRGSGMGVDVVVGNVADIATTDMSDFSGVLIQYPNTYGSAQDYQDLVDHVHAGGAKFVAATDPLACTVLKPPGEFDVDICLGTSQRLGVPMWYGGPHAAFMSVKPEFQRLIPGRIIGVSIDSQGNRALRMALQTREQFIKRERATSNICTAQALLANVAAAYGIYHGPEGLKEIALHIHKIARATSAAATDLGYQVVSADGEKVQFFDTVTLRVPSGVSADSVIQLGYKHGVNLRVVAGDDSLVGFSIDEATDRTAVEALITTLGEGVGKTAQDAIASLDANVEKVSNQPDAQGPMFGEITRTSDYMQHPVFQTHRSESQMLRYLASLAQKDLTLCQSMIPLGSCTMKLNATSELIPVSWPEITNAHPFAPLDQVSGYVEMIEMLNSWLASVTGFAAVSTQPNSGATGEYAGLWAIRKYHESRGDMTRDVCLIPSNAHGTNPASAVMAGMKVVVVKCSKVGTVDVADLEAKCKKYSDRLAAYMVTYPSTNGVFEEGVKESIEMIHQYGGQVYMDGANMNAQLGMCSPGGIGADVCHLNLHKTFAIPHGGGGPGVGSIGVARHLAPFLPGHSVVPVSGEGENVVVKNDLQIAAAQFGSAGVLPISWMFIRMMGNKGLLAASQTAILNANYMAKKLEGHYKILFKGKQGFNAHEFIVDMRPFKEYGITEDDVAKRLADYGFHAPTMSWPVAGTIMIEPTESEDKQECDRLVDALIEIRGEIQDVIDGTSDPKDNLLKNAPHTAEMCASDEWNHPYSREDAAFPTAWVKSHKFWPTVARVDNVWGDRNLMCTCPPLEEYEEED